MKKIVLTIVGLGVGLVLGVRASAEEWGTDFAKASETAKTSGKYMLLDFSGSDWCGWCMKLDKEVFKKAAFTEYAKQNLVCVLVDFPQEKPQSKRVKEQNQALSQKYGIKGYPTIIILSPTGELVAETGYQEGGAQKYVEHLQSLISKHKGATPKQ